MVLVVVQPYPKNTVFCKDYKNLLPFKIVINIDNTGAGHIIIISSKVDLFH